MLDRIYLGLTRHQVLKLKNKHTPCTIVKGKESNVVKNLTTDLS